MLNPCHGHWHAHHAASYTHTRTHMIGHMIHEKNNKNNKTHQKTSKNNIANSPNSTEIICLGRTEAVKSLGTAQCDFSLRNPRLVQFSSFQPESKSNGVGLDSLKAPVGSGFAVWSATFDCARSGQSSLAM